MDKRGQFTFYRSFYEAMMDFAEEEWLGYLLAVMEYGLDKKEPKGLSKTQQGMFKFVRPVLDTAWKKAESGSIGGKISKRGPAEKISKGERENEIEKDTEIETESEGEGFLRFWQRYPVKLGREEAMAEWESVSLENDFFVLMQGLENWIGSEEWSRDGGRFIPKPAKWLKEGWWRQTPRQAGVVVNGWRLGQAELEAIERITRDE